ncbi:hypothetical protein D9M73_188290 [compost metagenome]
MNKLLICLCVAAAAMTAGCAARVTSSTERSVIVRAGLIDAAGAQAAADAECKKRDRHARLNGKLSTNEFVFDCVQ